MNTLFHSGRQILGKALPPRAGRGLRRLTLLTSLVVATLQPGVLLASTEEVKQRFSLYCSVCHGDKGDGRSHAQQGLVPPPRDFTARSFAAAVTRERLIAAIGNGVPGTAMVAWQSEFDHEEIEELADFILSEFVGSKTVVPAKQNSDSARIYQETCSVCHGDDGKGAIWGQTSLSVKPRDFTSSKSRSELTRDRMIVSVRHGRPGTPMPGFGTQLSEQQIANIVDYVRSRFMKANGQSRDEHAPTAPSAAEVTDGGSDYGSRPLPNGLAGNFERGRSLYFQNCIECHGASGDGDGPRAYFIFPKPRDFLDPATQQILNRPRLYSGIADGIAGREMPAWKYVFSEQDIADVAEFVYSEFITPTALEP